MADLRKTLNVLAVWPEWLWRTKQSPARRHYCRAIADHPEVNYHLTGPGFEDWDDRRSGLQNVLRIMPDCDAIYAYKLAGTERGEIKDPQELSRHVLTIEAFNECWPGTHPDFKTVMHAKGGTAAEECRKAGVRLVVCHHANDMPRMRSVEEYGARLVHIPHGASTMFFGNASQPWDRRKGIVLTGAQNAEHYPLRRRWLKLIESGKLPGATVLHRSPNYMSGVGACDGSVLRYADVLGSHKVVLGCSSRWKYALARYPEVAMAGAVHVADMPDDVSDHFRNLVWEVSPESSDRELLDTVEQVVATNGLSAVHARSTAFKHFTTEHYAARLIGEIRRSLDS